MLIKKPSDISSSEITPKKLYLNRRNFLLGAGAVAGAAVVADRLGTIASPSDLGPRRNKIGLHQEFVQHKREADPV